MEPFQVDVEACSPSPGGEASLAVGLAFEALVGGVVSRYWSMCARKELVFTRELYIAA